jgi:hypothetical protein
MVPNSERCTVSPRFFREVSGSFVVLGEQQWTDVRISNPLVRRAILEVVEIIKIRAKPKLARLGKDDSVFENVVGRVR